MDHFHNDDQYEVLRIFIFNLEKGRVGRWQSLQVQNLLAQKNERTAKCSERSQDSQWMSNKITDKIL